jgi:endonuclease YncB( thermonuclease family)
MKRQLFVLGLVATFVLPGSGVSLLQAKPLKPSARKAKPAKSVKPFAARPKPVYSKPGIPKPGITKPTLPIVPLHPRPPIVVVPRVAPPIIISVGRVRPVRRTLYSTVVVEKERSVQPVRIVKILDTTHVLVSQAGKTRKVRLLGLDPVTSTEVYPEVHAAALDYMKKEFEGELVYLGFDESVGTEDEQGTRLAYVYRSEDRELLNEDVIEHGFAVAATTYEYDQKRDFRKDQSIAEKSRLGVWSVVSGLGG